MSVPKVAGLSSKTARGAMYLTLAMAGFRVAHLVSLIWLARILAPADFGRVSLVVATIAILAPLSDLGISEAVIHSRPNEASKAAFHGFVIIIATGAMLSFALSLLSSPISGLLGNSDVAGLMSWMAVSVFVDAFGRVPISLLEKGLMFGRVGVLSIISDLVYVACALILAYAGYGVWSLAIAHILRSVVRSVLGWSLSPGYSWLVPRRWDQSLVVRMLRYGIQTVASQSLALINSTWDNLFVGAAFGARSLGFYSKSYDFTNLIRSVNDMANRVLFPSYTLISSDAVRLSKAYVRTVGIISLITIPSSLGLLAIAPELVRTVLGDTWMPMVPVLQVLAFMGLVRPLSGTTAPLFLAVGRPSYNIWVSLVHTVIMIPLAVIFVGYGIVGVAIAVASAYSVGFCFNIYQVQKFLPGTALPIIRAIIPSAVASFAMTLVIFAAKGPLGRALDSASEGLVLIALVVLGMISFLTCVLVLDRPLLRDAVSLVAAAVGRSDEGTNDRSAVA